MSFLIVKQHSLHDSMSNGLRNHPTYALTDTVLISHLVTRFGDQVQASHFTDSRHALLASSFGKHCRFLNTHRYQT